jgi:hypothetical protein
VAKSPAHPFFTLIGSVPSKPFFSNKLPSERVLLPLSCFSLDRYFCVNSVAWNDSSLINSKADINQTGRQGGINNELHHFTDRICLVYFVVFIYAVIGGFSDVFFYLRPNLKNISGDPRSIEADLTFK